MLKFEKGTSAKGVLSLKRTYITTAMLNSCHNSFLAYGSPELLHTGKRFFPMVQGLNHEFQAIKQPGKKPFSLALCIFVYTCYVRILVSNSTKRVEGTTVTAEP